MPRPVLPVALATGLVLSGLAALAQPAAATSTDLVISCTVTATTAIPAVQGSGAVSPLVGQSVTTRGVVVAATPGLRGFYLQDPTGDGDPATSDGLFVYAPAATVAIGDDVAVTGPVSEFSGLTEVAATGVQVCGVAAVPPPTPYEMPEPVDGDLERLEGMSVVIPTELTVQQNFFLGRYGQLTLGSGGGATSRPTSTPRARPRPGRSRRTTPGPCSCSTTPAARRTPTRCRSSTRRAPVGPVTPSPG